MSTTKPDKFIALTPVRLEDFKSTTSQNNPTSMQVVRHFSHGDQTSRSAISANALSAAAFPSFPDENSPAFTSDWLNTEENDVMFPWLPSRPQAVLQVSDGSENFQVPHTSDDEMMAPIKPPPIINNRPSSNNNNQRSSNNDNRMSSNNDNRTSNNSDNQMSTNNDKNDKVDVGTTSNKAEKSQFVCSVCKKTYRLQSSLEKHLQVPCQVRPFKCEICFKAFKRLDHLKAHSRMHTGERPYSCSLCSKTFRQKNHLQRHAERKHVKGQEGEEEGEEGAELDENSSDVCGVEEMEEEESRTDEQD